MKHILLFMLCLFSLLCYSQQASVIYDDIQNNGSRTIMCSLVDLNPKDEVMFSVGLAANVDNGVTSYALIVETKTYSKIFFNQGMRLLLKDKNGTVTTLKAAAVDETGYETIELDGNYYNVYSVSTFYDITEQQLKKFATNGVIKIRQEYSGGTFDKEFNGTEISWIINEELPILKETLNKKTDIYSDF